jgi:hypothetical protein
MNDNATPENMSRLARLIAIGQSLNEQAVSETIDLCVTAWKADRDLLELAWGIIANAGGGDWSTQTQEWQDAAVRWRERWFAALAGEKP